MLLVDQTGLIQSVAPHDVTRVREILRCCPHGLRCITEMVRELLRCLVSRENNLPYSDRLTEAAARAIAGPLIGVAGTVPGNAGAIFDARLPIAPSGLGALTFDGRACGEAFHRHRPVRRAKV